MKKLVPFLAVAVLMPLASCNQKNATELPQNNEQEIERRVQERLAGERRAEQERKLQEKEQTLAEREKTLAERERDAERKRAEVVRSEEQERENARGVARTAPPVGEQSYD